MSIANIVAGAEKRRGKSVVKSRGKRTAEHTAQQRNTDSYAVQEAFELFVRVKDAENVKERTRAEYFNNFRYFIEWLADKYPGITAITQITSDILRDYINYLAYDKVKYEGNPYVTDERKQGGGLSPYTVNIRIRFLKAFFNVLDKEEVIRRNPANNIKVMKVDEDVKEPLTEAEVKRLLQQPDRNSFAQSRDLVIMLLMIDTGMRVNEIVALEVADIDFKSRCINLPASKNKNRKSRIIPLSGEIIRLLIDLIAENREHFDTNHVFISNFGEPLNIDSVRKSLYKYAKDAGIKKPVSPHVFRHFYAKQSALNGMDIFTLQRTLGHADISTTRKYVNMEKDDLIRQHNLYSPLHKVIKRS